MKKIAIITGSSSGMGAEFAVQLAEESALYRKKGNSVFPSDEIWLVARRKDKLEEVKNNILEAAQKSSRPDFYPSIKTVPLDISGSDGALKLKAALEEENESEKKNGGIEVNVLVNNAGFGTYGEFASTDTMREMQMIDLNCTSLTGITGFALPYMKKGSRIINTGSLASFLPLGNFAVYGASKAFVLSFSCALRAELKDRGISVTVLCPGPVSTEFANVASNGARKEVRHGLSPEKTVAHCIKASRKGKFYSMFAFKWKFKAAASRFVGRRAGAWFTFKFCKRPSN
ncbi:MAG: SDR family NAD(P)-dependent oxidoreductase [Treponema sp.]|nr:SDR family NAD(P)-dependent oxidoreductase [Treponema sp.]